MAENALVRREIKQLKGQSARGETWLREPSSNGRMNTGRNGNAANSRGSLENSKGSARYSDKPSFAVSSYDREYGVRVRRTKVLKARRHWDREVDPPSQFYSLPDSPA
ncbi:hypothetical protein KM043_001818 [Ampulex compressa]|nr:hypothetical protein KM043_001818 [Ampulex compressa]